MTDPRVKVGAFRVETREPFMVVCTGCGGAIINSLDLAGLVDSAERHQCAQSAARDILARYE